MLRALKQIGKSIGIEKGFEDDLLAPREGNKISVIKIKDDEINEIKKIEYEENSDDKYKYFYAGGNAALVGGALGIGGVSPFFIDLSKIQQKKIERSDGFNDYYKRKYNDNTVKNLLDFYKDNEEKFQKLESDWVYVKYFEGVETKERYEYFIKTYATAPQNKRIEWVEGNCSLCGKSGEMRDIRLPFFSLEVTNYNFGLASNEVDKGPLKLCQECEGEVVAGWKYLSNIFGNNYLLIPEPRFESMEGLDVFVDIAEANATDFEKLNNLIFEKEIYETLEFRFLVTERQQSKLNILKSVSNYYLFAKKFKDEHLILDDELKYYPQSGIDIQNRTLKNYFDLENILKFYFVNEGNYYLDDLYGQTFHFYQLYNTDLPKKMNSKFKHQLYAHRDELFSFIYETNLDALPKKSLNEIVENFLRYEFRDHDTGNNFDPSIVRSKIIEGLNYYYFLCSKIYGESNMKNKTKELKKYFDKFEEPETKEKIRELVNEEDNSLLVYYLIGQLIGNIDDFRYKKGNKNSIFSDFVESLNRKNAKQRFAEEILQGQIYYIEKSNPKAKFVFDILADNLNNLFKQKSFSDVLIAIVSGYYGENILKSEKRGEEK
ncbi:MAG: hypothetical protein ACLFVB_06435 [Thermoplasmata archaeon]